MAYLTFLRPVPISDCRQVAEGIPPPQTSILFCFCSFSEAVHSNVFDLHLRQERIYARLICRFVRPIINHITIFCETSHFSTVLSPCSDKSAISHALLHVRYVKRPHRFCGKGETRGNRGFGRPPNAKMVLQSDTNSIFASFRASRSCGNHDFVSQRSGLFPSGFFLVKSLTIFVFFLTFDR